MTFNPDHQNQLFDDLVEILTNEISIYNKLEDVLKKKQQAIISGAINELRKYVDKEQTLISQAQLIADTRVAHISAWMEAGNVSKEIPRLATIIKLAPTFFGPKLTHLRDLLKVSLDKVAYANRENNFLLNTSIEYVRGLAQLFLQTEDKTPQVYSKEGMAAMTEHETKVLDCQI